MKKSIILIILPLALSFLMSCNSKELKNQWAEKSLIIDGNFDDWEGYDLRYFEDENLIMGTLNDFENVYMMVRFTNMQLARKINRHGVTIWIDKQGKKKKTYGIQYTGSYDIHQNLIKLKQQLSQPDFPMHDDNVQRLSARIKPDVPGPGKIRIIENEDKRELDENQLHGVAAGSQNYNGMFCYEFRLPLPIGLQSKEKLDLCFEIGGLSSDEMKDLMASRKGNPDGMSGRPGGVGGRPGGMGGRPQGMGRPGGMGAGRGGFGRGQRPDSKFIEEQDIWMKLILAEKP
jgi:hypothetical protein